MNVKEILKAMCVNAYIHRVHARHSKCECECARARPYYVYPTLLKMEVLLHTYCIIFVPRICVHTLYINSDYTHSKGSLMSPFCA